MNETLTILNDLKTITDKKNINWDKLKNSTVLITGSTGMLGKFIIKILEFLNEFFHFRINIVPLGHDTLITEKLILNCDYFFHTASPSGSGAFIEDELFKCNVLGIINILGYLKKIEDRKLKGFIFFSSGEALNPSNAYGWYKRTGEKLCDNYRNNRLPIYTVRFDHTFGPTMNLEKDKRVFAEFVRNILDGKHCKANNPQETRTFTYITDAMVGLFLAILNSKPGEYNISKPDNLISIGNLAYTLNVMYDRYSFDPFMDNCKPVPTKKSLDISTLKQLGYRPIVSSIVGFKRVIEHFRELKK